MAAIAQGPLAFVLATREADMSVQVIRNKLIQASSDATEDEVDGLLVLADGLYRADQRLQGVRRIWKGVGFLVGGLVVTVPLAGFTGALAIFGVILVAMGVFQLGKGIHELQG